MGRFRSLRTRLGIVGELMSFLWQNKLWWLIPMMVTLLLLGLLLVLGQNPVIAPFIYTLF